MRDDDAPKRNISGISEISRSQQLQQWRQTETLDPTGSYRHRYRSPQFSDDDDEVDELMDDSSENDFDEESDGPPRSPMPYRTARTELAYSNRLNYPPIPSSSATHPSLIPPKASLRLPPMMNDMDARSKSSSKLPPIYTQFMREFSAAPVSSASNLPPTDPPPVPRETCTELRRQHINPHWVVLPRFGERCPFSDKPSCLRTDWRPAMWERHVQTHLPDTLKEYWECPHCFRPFNRKCAFVNHLRKTRTDCGMRGTLDECDESQWKSRWFHEPMPLRSPEGAIQRRKWLK